jgi:aryl-alcohol dehydrogenase-like predicted oxidoreductase
MSSEMQAVPGVSQSTLPQRALGQTGHAVTLFGLGGEGVLRTSAPHRRGRMRHPPGTRSRCQLLYTAPAYAGSLDYYGAALGERRSEIFLASKTHDRTRAGSLQLLDKSLQRLRTDHLDLWQLHDLRTPADLARIFGKGGALKALVQAVRRVGCGSLA